MQQRITFIVFLSLFFPLEKFEQREEEIEGESKRTDSLEEQKSVVAIADRVKGKLAGEIVEVVEIDENPKQQIELKDSLGPTGISKTYQLQQKNSHLPLAERVRPKKLSEVIGQDHILGDSCVLSILLAQKTLPSLIFWGPPGTGFPFNRLD
jgi:hypothetical protein